MHWNVSAYMGESKGFSLFLYKDDITQLEVLKITLTIQNWWRFCHGI